MTKGQLKSVLEQFKLIKEKQSAGLFADCRAFALETAEAVTEETGGEQAAVLLKEYSELLSKAENGAGGKVLRKHVVKVENAVRALAGKKLEVVFFPYKAEMWDSLESVWLAACEDPACDVYVVPLPSYERLPDDSLGDERYDGDRYPANVPVTDWRTYDVEKQKPDIIFTHYAYDDLTRNASIPPDFYAPRLRANCRLLAHIPYFVHGEYKVHDYDAVIPGVMYAHRVVLESEEVRRQYMEHYGKIYSQYRMKGQYEAPEEKFIALGSPKFDKVLGANKVDYKLPEEWERLIYKPDGSARKIILFNTHMYTWINTGEQYFKKLRSVFEIFAKRDDAVLWWRPHPQTELNFKTQAADKYGEYIQLIEDYKQSGIGIYDETQDAHRAIAWSDAYYGDASSLVTLYKHTGKPVLISNPEYIHEKTALNPHCILVDGNDILLKPQHLNTLMKFSRKDWTPEYTGVTVGDNGWMAGTAQGGESIWFPPFKSDKIGVCSTGDGLYRELPYRNVEIKSEVFGSFYGAAAHGDSIYFTPAMYPAIMRLNRSTEEITYHCDWLEPLEKLTHDPQDVYFLYPVTVGGSLWLASCRANAVVEFNMETSASTVHEVGKKGYAYIGMCYDGESFWLTPRHNNPLVKWNPKTGETKEFAVDRENRDFPFLQPVTCGGTVWVLPFLANRAFRIDPRTDEISVAEEFERCYDRDAPQKYDKYGFVCADGESIFAYHISGSKLVEYNCATGDYQEHSLSYCLENIPGVDALLGENISRELENNGIVHERHYAPLSGYITWVSNRTEAPVGNIANSGGDTGETIYRYITKEIRALAE